MRRFSNTKHDIIKRILYKQQSEECIYCDRKLPYKLLEVDHIVPGVWGEFNFILSCTTCNGYKSNFLLGNIGTSTKHLTWEMLYRIITLQRNVMRILYEIHNF